MIYFIFLLFGKIMIFALEGDQEAVPYQLSMQDADPVKNRRNDFTKLIKPGKAVKQLLPIRAPIL